MVGPADAEPVMLRHKTAIRRGDYSRPVKYLLRDGLLDKTLSFVAYGFGRGEDLDLLPVTASPALAGTRRSVPKYILPAGVARWPRSGCPLMRRRFRRR